MDDDVDDRQANKSANPRAAFSISSSDDRGD